MLRTLLAVLVLAGCTAAAAGAAPLRVLFVGNSLTAANDLPGMLSALSAAVGGPEIETGRIAPGGYALEDHWASGEARTALASGGWDVVVMQQGPSSLPESRTNLVEWSKRWADEARAAHVRPALFTVWPESYRAASAFAAVIGSYRAAALASQSLLLPAGLAWRLALQRAPKLRLYGPDGFHPSALGTFAAALVIYGGLTGRIPPRLPPTVQGLRLSARDARVLRRAAVDALATGR